MWYQNAVICYVHLADVNLSYINALASGHATTATGETQQGGDQVGYTRDQALLRALGPSRWFIRGWTLQELLAPSRLQFLDRNCKNIGALSDIDEVVSRITKIPLDALRKYTPLNRFSVAKRMSWAANRETTILEDRAYCLLGLFDINMPLLYGEGERSFVRLQKEIVRTSNDQSILVWGGSNLAFFYPRYSLFAPSPDLFQHCGRVANFDLGDPHTVFELTNNGLRISTPVLKTSRRRRASALLNCYDEQTPHKIFALPIMLHGNGEALFYGRDVSWCSLRNFERLQRSPRTLVFTERNSSPNESAASSNTRKVLLRFFDARLHNDTDCSFVLRRVCGRPAWDIESLTWNPHTLAAFLPALLTAGFEIDFNYIDCPCIRIVFSDLGGAEHSPLPSLNATIVEQDVAEQSKTLQQSCYEFETKAVPISPDEKGGGLRCEKSVPLNEQLEVRVVSKRLRGMKCIKVTLRDRPSTLRHTTEAVRRIWRSMREDQKSRRQGYTSQHPTVSTAVLEHFIEVGSYQEIAPDAIITRKQIRHHYYNKCARAAAGLAKASWVLLKGLYMVFMVLVVRRSMLPECSDDTSSSS
jgi:hypothetical protein